MAGFREVIEGAEYDGVKISYIAVDTRDRFHLFPKKDNTLSPQEEAVAMLDSRTYAAPDLDNKDVFWLWENMVSEGLQG